MMKDYEDLEDRNARLKNKDNEIFRQAYLGLQASVKYAQLNFRGFPICRRLEQQLKEYTPRFKTLPELCVQSS